MMKLEKSKSAWGSENFKDVLKDEILNLDIGLLPLQQGLTLGHTVSDSAIDVMIIRVTESKMCIDVKLGVFYQGVISGCSCADDPSANNETTEYCVLQLVIDKDSSETSVTLTDE